MDNSNKEKQNFKCPKCSGLDYKMGEIRTSGSFWTKIFNIENKCFATVTCTNCKYTELYQGTQGKGENILDFLAN
ncbi:MAG: zinc ribbon domain-containing protein [Patescibacteria group bacterium]|jgi:predicted nucleic-acid-binding Zn-ribbon protein|nr:zinc ribbon domain-containing protein [Patescibacteria group bacterium]